MTKKFNWGIIGLGHIAHKFVDDLRRTPGAQLHAVASRDIERATDFAKLYEARHTYGSYEEIVACPGLDAVYIATPHIGHFKNTIMCLEHKIPVLCEKPFAMNSEELRKMINLAVFQKTFLMEALWTRFLPTIEKTLELIAADAIGEVRTLKADFGFRAQRDPKRRLFNQNLGGGSLLDVGIYPVFLALLLFGKPSSISAEAAIGPTNVDEDCGMLLKFPSQKLAVLHSTITTKTNTEALIYGEKGKIHIHSRWHEPTSMSLHKADGTVEDFFFDYDSNGYKYEIQEVMNLVRGGKMQSEKMPLDFSMLLMNVLDDIRMQAGIFYPMYDHFSDKEIATRANRFSQN